MKFENVGFPVREPMLASGEVDAVFGFSFSVYLNLKSRGLPVDDIVVMLMRDHGVDLYGNVLIVSPKFAAEKPDAVKGFIKALIKGTRDTVADPAAATATVIKRNDVAKQDVEKERLDLALAQNMVTPWVTGQRLRRHRPGALRQVDRPDRSHVHVQGEAEGGRRVHRGVPAAGRRPQGELRCAIVIPALVAARVRVR